MNVESLSRGEKISCISAILLFIFMFFNWFSVKAINTSGLLFDVQAGGPERSAWEALEYIPIILLITSIITLAATALRFAGAARQFLVALNGLVAVLGFISISLIIYRMVNPPIFYATRTITNEGAVRLPMLMALLAATGIALGGCLALWEKRCLRLQ